MLREFAAYFDDSGHPDQDLVVVAGFIAVKEQWLKLETEWRDTLDSAGLGRSTVFHMTDFAAGAEKSPFCGWDERRKHRLLDKLVHIIAVRTRKHISETVFMRDYRLVNEKYALEECYGAPYAIAGRNITMRLKSWLREQGSDVRMSVSFEDGTKHKGDFIDACKRDELECPTFVRKEDMVPLQAADLLAWEIAKNIRRRVRNSEAVIDYYFDVITRYGWQPGDDGAYGIKQLESICDGTEGFDPVPLRSEIGQNYYIAHRALKKKQRRRTVY